MFSLRATFVQLEIDMDDGRGTWKDKIKWFWSAESVWLPKRDCLWSEHTWIDFFYEKITSDGIKSALKDAETHKCVETLERSPPMRTEARNMRIMCISDR